MIKQINDAKSYEELEERLMTELEDRNEYGCWGGYCSGHCDGVYS